MTPLTTHFTLDELTATTTGLYNYPPEWVAHRLFYLATFILEPIRERWGAYTITSGYRSEPVNRAVGGSVDSQHLIGEACDGGPKVANIDRVFDWLAMASGIAYGQAILETVNQRRWIHISLPRPNKRNHVTLTYDGHTYSPYHSA